MEIPAVQIPNILYIKECLENRQKSFRYKVTDQSRFQHLFLYQIRVLYIGNFPNDSLPIYSSTDKDIHYHQ